MQRQENLFPGEKDKKAKEYIKKALKNIESDNISSAVCDLMMAFYSAIDVSVKRQIVDLMCDIKTKDADDNDFIRSQLHPMTMYLSVLSTSFPLPPENEITEIKKLAATCAIAMVQRIVIVKGLKVAHEELDSLFSQLQNSICSIRKDLLHNKPLKISSSQKSPLMMIVSRHG